jgi:4-amino-4-deoxy-L-arabinose transferase-like glycosyltransferase
MLNRESETEDRKCLLWLLVLAGGFFLLRCPVIGEYFDYHFDEHFYTNGALEMLKGGDYLTPHTADGELRFNKPPLTYWLVILGFKLFGVSPFSARLPFLLIGCVLIGLTYRLASILLGQAGTDSQFPNSRKLVSVPASLSARFRSSWKYCPSFSRIRRSPSA